MVKNLILNKRLLIVIKIWKKLILILIGICIDLWERNPSKKKKEINSLEEIKKQFYIISKKINRVFEYCSKNDEFNYIIKKYQKYIDEVLKPKYEIQKIKMKIEIIECMNAGINAYYTNFIDANPPYYD